MYHQDTSIAAIISIETLDLEICCFGYQRVDCGLNTASKSFGYSLHCLFTLLSLVDSLRLPHQDDYLSTAIIVRLFDLEICCFGLPTWSTCGLHTASVRILLHCLFRLLLSLVDQLRLPHQDRLSFNCHHRRLFDLEICCFELPTGRLRGLQYRVQSLDTLALSFNLLSHWWIHCNFRIKIDYLSAL
jgi:hypothetical protein